VCQWTTQGNDGCGALDVVLCGSAGDGRSWGNKDRTGQGTKHWVAGDDQHMVLPLLPLFYIASALLAVCAQLLLSVMGFVNDTLCIGRVDKS
jgi:hypothetical protein